MLLKFYAFALSAALSILLWAAHLTALDEGLYPAGFHILKLAMVLAATLATCASVYLWVHLHHELKDADVVEGQRALDRLPL